MVQGVKGEKNKHYSKTEAGECSCNTLKDDVALMNKQIYLLTKNILSIFILGKASDFYSEIFLYKFCISKMEKMIKS